MSQISSRLCLSILICLSTLAMAEDDPALETMQAMFEFAPYQGGNILPEQIPGPDWRKFHVIDTRRPRDYAESHIPGSINIEWRQVLSRRDQFSDDKPSLLYCNTGSLSAQAAFALKAAGYENVYILTGGFDAWKAKGGFDAHARAARRPSP